MTTKKKIIAALGCALDDISEERLLDILLDAYAGKKKRIQELERENLAERERLHQDLECIRREQDRMRSDPLYSLGGDYYFFCNGRKMLVQVQGGQIQMCERIGTIDYCAKQVARESWK